VRCPKLLSTGCQRSPRGMAEGFIRQRGNAWQVIVHAGHDPVTGKRRNLTDTARTKRVMIPLIPSPAVGCAPRSTACSRIASTIRTGLSIRCVARAPIGSLPVWARPACSGSCAARTAVRAWR
jgi:hypothetical protein